MTRVLCTGSSPSCGLASGCTFSPKKAGADRGVDSDVNPATGATEPLALGTGAELTSIDAGNDHTCAVSDDARLFCWGSQPGRGNLLEPAVVDLSNVTVHRIDLATDDVKPYLEHADALLHLVASVPAT